MCTSMSYHLTLPNVPYKDTMVIHSRRVQEAPAAQPGRVLAAQVLPALRDLQGAVGGDDGLPLGDADVGRAVDGRQRRRDGPLLLPLLAGPGAALADRPGRDHRGAARDHGELRPLHPRVQVALAVDLTCQELRIQVDV